MLVAYNFIMKPEMTQAIEAARKTGMGIVAMKALAGGLSRVQRGDRLYGASQEGVMATLKREGAMAAAIRWVMKDRSVDTAIVCMTDFDQLEENLAAARKPWGAEDEKLLAAHLAAISPLYCRMCGTCAGTCERGIPVADVLRILTYAEGYRQFSLARERFLELPERAREARCADCGACTVQCPNGVRVRERVSRARDLFA